MKIKVLLESVKCPFFVLINYESQIFLQFLIGPMTLFCVFVSILNSLNQNELLIETFDF
jgi:hypothetical protein